MVGVGKNISEGFHAGQAGAVLGKLENGIKGGLAECRRLCEGAEGCQLAIIHLRLADHVSHQAWNVNIGDPLISTALIWNMFVADLGWNSALWDSVDELLDLAPAPSGYWALGTTAGGRQLDPCFVNSAH
ncbi:MAG: hypothetical protein EBS21_02335 [Sphingomonadaceae bacterium]|nr:hypothetical protein [Sphingomonadaceae bacterium]